MKRLGLPLTRERYTALAFLGMKDAEIGPELRAEIPDLPDEAESIRAHALSIVHSGHDYDPDDHDPDDPEDPKSLNRWHCLG
jgi:hypothetical protein